MNLLIKILPISCTSIGLINENVNEDSIKGSVVLVGLAIFMLIPLIFYIAKTIRKLHFEKIRIKKEEEEYKKSRRRHIY